MRQVNTFSARNWLGRIFHPAVRAAGEIRYGNVTPAFEVTRSVSTGWPSHAMPSQALLEYPTGTALAESLALRQVCGCGPGITESYNAINNIDDYIL